MKYGIGGKTRNIVTSALVSVGNSICNLASVVSGLGNFDMQEILVWDTHTIRMRYGQSMTEAQVHWCLYNRRFISICEMGEKKPTRFSYMDTDWNLPNGISRGWLYSSKNIPGFHLEKEITDNPTANGFMEVMYGLKLAENKLVSYSQTRTVVSRSLEMLKHTMLVAAYNWKKTMVLTVVGAGDNQSALTMDGSLDPCACRLHVIWDRDRCYVKSFYCPECKRQMLDVDITVEDNTMWVESVSYDMWTDMMIRISDASEPKNVGDLIFFTSTVKAQRYTTKAEPTVIPHSTALRATLVWGH